MDALPRLGIILHQFGPIEGGSPFGPLTPYYRQLAERAMLSGWRCYLFSPRDVLRQRQTVWAWIRSDSSWERQFVALPHIAYTRLGTLTQEDGEILRWLREEGGTVFLNQPEIEEIVQDRWRLGQILQSHPSLNSHLPELSLLRDQGPNLKLLSESSAVHVTSRFRSVTRGRILLSLVGEDIQLRHEQANAAFNRTIRNADSLRAKVEELVGEAVAEPYTEPLRFEGCPVLVRAFWQRGRTGRWQETAAILRLGLPSAQTYQGVTAGLFDRYQESLHALIGKQLKAVRYQLESTSQVVVDLLDKRSHGVGELTIDYLLTAKNEVQIVDVSTLAGVESIQRLTTPEIRLRAMTTTLGYAALLLEQTKPTVGRELIDSDMEERLAE